MFANSWYRDFCPQFDLANGGLCLITACYKVPVWNSGYYISATSDCRFVSKHVVPPTHDDTIEFIEMLQNVEGKNSTPLRDEMGSYYPDFAEEKLSTTLHNQKHCIMARGFYISLDPSVYNKCRTPYTTWRTIWSSLPATVRPRLKSWSVPPRARPVCVWLAQLNNHILKSPLSHTTRVRP